MKTLLIGLALLALAAPVQGHELCDTLKSAAETTMKSRQIGLPKSMLETILLNMKTQLSHQELLQHMIDKAYEEPIHSSESAQQLQIRRYGLIWEAACYDSLGR